MTAERVTAERLRELWFSDAAVGFTEDLSRGVRGVTLEDGRSFETPIAEIQAARGDQ